MLGPKEWEKEGVSRRGSVAGPLARAQDRTCRWRRTSSVAVEGKSQDGCQDMLPFMGEFTRASVSRGSGIRALRARGASRNGHRQHCRMVHESATRLRKIPSQSKRGQEHPRCLSWSLTDKLVTVLPSCCRRETGQSQRDGRALTKSNLASQVEQQVCLLGVQVTHHNHPRRS